MRSTFLVFVCLVPLLGYSQKTAAVKNKGISYLSGRLISTENDTLTGYFHFAHTIGIRQKIYYKETLQSDKKTLKAGKFKLFLQDAFKSNPPQVFAALKVPYPGSAGDVKLFLPRILAGEIELYLYKVLVNNTYPQEILYMKLGSRSWKLPKKSKALESHLSLFLKTHPESMAKINNEKITYDNVIPLIERYNLRVRE